MPALTPRPVSWNEKSRAAAASVADIHCDRWRRLCDRFLPCRLDDSIFLYSRDSRSDEPAQGWKLHVSATILEACDVFEAVAPYLARKGAQFKAPRSLDDLSTLNGGLELGYQQVGKFVTVYPESDELAIEIAAELDRLTQKFFPVNVPYDSQYLPDSSVFYRYGAFAYLEATDHDGNKFPAIQNPAGELVADDRMKSFPDWVRNPFPARENAGFQTFAGTPLGERYRVIEAMTQRGKGGTYKAADFNSGQPRFCVIKEGRKNGDLGWNGQDGYALVKHEFETLQELKKSCDFLPAAFSSFEIFGSFYFAAEYIDGESLQDMLRKKSRRYTVREVLLITRAIAGIIRSIHLAGWVWNDCKASNLIVTRDYRLRPIDFEGAYRIGEPEPFDWKSRGFSDPKAVAGTSADVFALGAVAYFLLTGRLYDELNPTGIKVLRRNVPAAVLNFVNGLLNNPAVSIADVSARLSELLAGQMKITTN